MVRLRSSLCVLVLFWPLLAGAAAEPRIALVIGNSEYASGSLPNPANDARLIGEALTALGFEVISRRNADQTTMKRAIQDFGARLEKAGPGAVGLFYYAGHGAQLNGRNYLVPTTARIEREGDMDIEAVSADWVIEQMRYARNRLNIVILDACRNNPFSRSMRSASRGLAVMDAPAGILIAYSTAPGSVAADGDGRNSPYTEALSRAMREANEPVEQVFKRTRVAVMNASAGRQIPWEASSLTGDFYFAGSGRRTDAAAASSASTAPAPRVTSPVATAAAPARPAATPATYAPPASTSTSGGGSWFSGLLGWFSTPSGAGGANGSGGTVPGTRVLSMLQSLGVDGEGIDPGHSYPPASVRPMLASAPRRATLGSTPEQIRAAFALCRGYSAACQLEWYADEGLRAATLSPFDMDIAPVTVADFRQFVEATHYRTEAEAAGYAYALDAGRLKAMKGGSWRNGVSQRPIDDASAVVGVSFQDAAAYCRYRGARLPTEDEWEYAARGPERRTFPWGESAESSAATAAAPRADAGTAGGLGGRYRGLSGNVWQWVDSTVEGRKVLKGGSWLEPNAANRRAAARRYELARRADEDSGFRCARSVAEWPDAAQNLAALGP